MNPPCINSRWPAPVLFLLLVLTPPQVTADTIIGPFEWNVQSGGNGHNFELVFPDSGFISWDDANSTASTMVLLGAQGHLATLTSAAEDNFVRASFSPFMEVRPIGSNGPIGDR